MYDASLADFPRFENENDDTKRILRALAECANGVLYFPKGIYLVAETIKVDNLCSLLLHKSAILRAVSEMDYVIIYDALLQHDKSSRTPDMPEDYNLFIRGGQIDGNGLSSCLSLGNYHHFTMADMTFLNGRKYGLRVDDFGHGYELIANNLYFKCVMGGLGGNVALSTSGGDSHYIDCVVVDYTVGFELLPGTGANRLTRCHTWGGPVPPIREGEYPEMLKDSINFRVRDGGSILTDCYADSGQTGFEIAADTRLIGCSYFNNPRFGLSDIKIIRHECGRLFITNGRFSKTAPSVKPYEGCNDVVWRDNLFPGFDASDIPEQK